MTANKTNIEHRVLKTTAVSFLSTGISIVLQLITVPVCLHYWGKSVFGVWLSLSAAYTLLRTIDGGFTSYIGNKINLLYHKEQQQMRVVMASAIWGVLLLGALQIIFVLLLFITHNMDLIMGKDITNLTGKETLIGLIIMSVTWILTGSYIGILHRFLIPVGMLYQLLWWMLLLQVSQSLAIFTSAYLNLSILQTAILFAIAQSMVYISSAIYIKHKQPQYYPWLANSNIKIGIKEIFHSIPMTINGMIMQLGNSGLVVLIASMLGAAVVPVYTTMRTLNNLWTTVTNIVTAPLLPDIIRFHANREPHKFYAVHQMHLIMMNVIINLSLLLLYPFIPYLYEFWTRNTLGFNHTLISLLMASVSVFSINSLFNVFLTGLNNNGYLIAAGLLRGLFVIVISWILLNYFGSINGVGYAVLFTELLLFVINTYIFIRNEMNKMGMFNQNLFTWYNYLSFISVIMFLFASAILNHISIIYYIITIIIVCISIVFSWQNLDYDVKKRIKKLLRIAK